MVRLMRKGSLASLLCALLCTLIVACADLEGPANTSASASSEVFVPSRGDVYTPGVAKVAADGLKVTLVESTPALKYIDKYTWRLSLETASEDPAVPVAVTSADISATPTMPAHGHGTVPPVTSASATSEGLWELQALDLFMPGLWRIELNVRWTDPTASDAPQRETEVVFEFELLG